VLVKRTAVLASGSPTPSTPYKPHKRLIIKQALNRLSIKKVKILRGCSLFKKNAYFCIIMARDKIHTPLKEALIQDDTRWIKR
jgi:hypothetical protein